MTDGLVWVPEPDGLKLCFPVPASEPTIFQLMWHLWPWIINPAVLLYQDVALWGEPDVVQGSCLVLAHLTPFPNGCQSPWWHEVDLQRCLAFIIYLFCSFIQTFKLIYLEHCHWYYMRKSLSSFFCLNNVNYCTCGVDCGSKLLLFCLFYCYSLLKTL